MAFIRGINHSCCCHRVYLFSKVMMEKVCIAVPPDRSLPLFIFHLDQSKLQLDKVIQPEEGSKKTSPFCNWQPAPGFVGLGQAGSLTLHLYTSLIHVPPPHWSPVYLPLPTGLWALAPSVLPALCPTYIPFPWWGWAGDVAGSMDGRKTCKRARQVWGECTKQESVSAPCQKALASAAAPPLSMLMLALLL